MEPAAARRRPTDVVAGARRAPVSLVEVAASGTAARGGRRRPSLSLLCRVGSVLAAIFAPRQICLVALSFQALHDGVYPWRLCPRSTKTAVSSTFTACFVRRLVRCAYLLRLPFRKTDLRREAQIHHGQSRPVVCKRGPFSTSRGILKNFGQAHIFVTGFFSA